MRLFMLIAGALSLSAATDPLIPLAGYNGTWQVSRTNGAKPDLMVNSCARVGHYYACEQSVDGGPGALLVFIPRMDKPGAYYTQNIRPEGRATSRADLAITGNVWTFLSNWDNSGRTIYYRTVDTFESRGKIKFEMAESQNGRDWKLTDSGEQSRVVHK